MNIGFRKDGDIIGKVSGRRRLSRIFGDAVRRMIRDIWSAKQALLVLGACFLFLWLSAGSICPMQAVTGIPCPGCGLTRAGLKVLTLNFAGAWQMNPFIFPVGILMIVWGLYRYLLLKKPGTWFGWCAAAVLAGLVAFYIWRMVCFFPGEPPVNYLESCLAERFV